MAAARCAAWYHLDGFGGAGAEMRTIHSAFRRELGLHHHHTIEDGPLWPMLLERVPVEIAPIVELMESQHGTVAALLERTIALRTQWRTDADAFGAAELAAVYGRMHDALVEHLDAEEQHVMPLVEACVYGTPTP